MTEEQIQDRIKILYANLSMANVANMESRYADLHEWLDDLASGAARLRDKISVLAEQDARKQEQGGGR